MSPCARVTRQWEKGDAEMSKANLAKTPLSTNAGFYKDVDDNSLMEDISQT